MDQEQLEEYLSSNQSLFATNVFGSQSIIFLGILIIYFYNIMIYKIKMPKKNICWDSNGFVANNLSLGDNYWWKAS